ncbi:MAG: zinc ribbon domain-containing protein [Muribaculaceae bacterium]|nr:zinc ribbon domain-containing protein [Muribaculaceae bacterium]MBR6489724.1 zinc ribbon domain-containing protein [Muribaculaceae bacterium]
MHIFCPECGKHIDVSLEELENQEGHLVCPQCLASIDVDVNLFNGNSPQSSTDVSETTIDVSNDNNDSQENLLPPELPKQTMPPAPPVSKKPPEPPQQPPHIDDVMRYCKQCGAFLKEGANFCPRCGKYVRVIPPSFKQQATTRTVTPPSHPRQTLNQSPYKPPTTVPLPQRNTYSRNSSRNNNKKNSGSKFSIFTLGGCLTFTLVTVALFFIIYIVLAYTNFWS